MALRGLSTLSTLRIFTTDIALDLHATHDKKQSCYVHLGKLKLV